jgi:hypothetical protein
VMRCQKSLHESCRMGRRIVMLLICSLGHCECDGHSTQAQSTASHCRMANPMGEWLFRDVQLRSPLKGCQVTRPHDRFSRYSKWLDTYRTALVWISYNTVPLLPLILLRSPKFIRKETHNIRMHNVDTLHIRTNTLFAGRSEIWCFRAGVYKGGVFLRLWHCVSYIGNYIPNYCVTSQKTVLFHLEYMNG